MRLASVLAAQIVGHGLVKEQVRIYESRPGLKPAALVVRWVQLFQRRCRLRRHQRLEVFSVRVRGPNLAHFDGIAERFWVGRQPIQRRRQKVTSQWSHDVTERSEHDLKRSQTLLTIDHFRRWNLPNQGLGLAQNHSPKKVLPRWTVVGRTVSAQDLNLFLHISPEGFPLLVLVPHVLALEKRHEVASRLVE